MGRPRRTQEPKPGPSHRMDVDSDSDSDEPVSQVQRSMRKVNVSQNGRGKTRGKQVVVSDSDEEPQPARNTQRLNGTHNKSRGKARQISESESDGEPQPSTSRASQATQKRKRTNASHRAHQTLSQAGETFIGEEISASQISPNSSLTEQEHNHHIANVVKYILSADQAKKTAIQKATISKSVNCHNKNFKEIFKAAQDVLKDVFGYEMLDLDNENNDGRNNPNAKFQKFILVNTIEGDDSHDNVDEDTTTKYALLFLSLTHIYMNGGKCTVDSLGSFLRRLDIVTDHHVRHEQFGDAMETVTTDFVKEKYIQWSEDKTELLWGVRAIKELKPRAVMEFISEIFDGRALNTWPEEYERLLQIEQGDNQRPNGRVNGERH